VLVVGGVVQVSSLLVVTGSCCAGDVSAAAVAACLAVMFTCYCYVMCVSIAVAAA
jgi:hypothetical protein